MFLFFAVVIRMLYDQLITPDKSITIFLGKKK